MNKELERIKKEIADIGCQFIWNKTCEELAKEICSRVAQQVSAPA